MANKVPFTIAVVIPCFRVREQILGVLAAIGPEVSWIYVVDDSCPESTAETVRSQCTDARVIVIENEKNLGVGGATMVGYQRAIEDGATVIVKLDGDGQMDPGLIPRFIHPLLAGEADYAKGNRFQDPSDFESMPAIRRLGNLALSFLTKLSAGYWHIFDPTNGYTAIHASVARLLPFNKISERYFFESDLLFRLQIAGAVLCDIPMKARYSDETSGIRITRVFPEFLAKHARNFVKRITYQYFLLDLNVASIELTLGLILFVFGVTFGTYQFLTSAAKQVFASAGTVMLAALPIIIGIQMLLSFLNFDVSRRPPVALHRRLFDHLPID